MTRIPCEFIYYRNTYYLVYTEEKKVVRGDRILSAGAIAVQTVTYVSQEYGTDGFYSTNFGGSALYYNITKLAATENEIDPTQLEQLKASCPTNCFVFKDNTGKIVFKEQYILIEIPFT